MTKLEKLKKFLQENHPYAQVFNTRNIAGDYMVTVYCADDIQVDYCADWEYIEIFGLTEEEFDSLLDKKAILLDRLREFIEGKDYPKEVKND